MTLKNKLIIFNILLITILNLGFCYEIFSQSANDTINKYNNKREKSGYWIEYLDSNFSICNKDSAVYFLYCYYYKGYSTTFEILNEIKNSNSFKFYPKNSIETSEKPYPLNGTLLYKINKTYEDEQTLIVDSGYPKIFSYEYEIINDSTSSGFTGYLDSLLSDRKETYLVVNFSNNIPIFKQYYCNSSPITKEYPCVGIIQKKTQNVIKTGCQFQDRFMFEIGFSERFKKTYIVKKNNYKADYYPAFTEISLTALPYTIYEKKYWEQKITLSYIANIIIVNIGYVHFKREYEHDNRLFYGVGITALGNFSIIYNRFIPIQKTYFGNISKNSLCINIGIPI